MTEGFIDQEALDRRAQREVANLEKVIALRVDALQEELDRRVIVLQREMAVQAEVARNGRLAEREHAVMSRQILEARVDAMDKATEVLNEIVTRVPTDVQQAVGNLAEVLGEKFASIETQFAERDTRQERESRDNKVAVDAAFAAQKEAAAKQDESNAKAIDKSELATSETIKTLAELNRTSSNALSDKIDDLKQRLTALEASRQNSREGLMDHRAGVTATTSIIYLFIAAMGIFVTIAIATHGFTR